jgi:hypothetical protein
MKKKKAQVVMREDTAKCANPRCGITLQYSFVVSFAMVSERGSDNYSMKAIDNADRALLDLGWGVYYKDHRYELCPKCKQQYETS